MHLWSCTGSKTVKKKVVEVLHKIRFMVEKLTHCENDVVFLAIYVDDNLIVGHPDENENTIEQLKRNEFVVKVEDDLKVYLSCEM
ncbi:hypothetical protein ACHAXS_001587 [Conticribra weissflogii]